jgi:hypothetical protein
VGKIGGITVPVSPAKLSPWWITRVFRPVFTNDPSIQTG